MRRWLLLVLIVASWSASAIVIRDDVADAAYRVEASEFPALVDLPHEGHGVLIAPEWVLTAAHAVSWRSGLDHVVAGGEPRKVERVVVHPGFQPPPQALIDQALATGDGVLAVLQIAASDDVALLKLAAPVTDITPATLHSAGKEFGRTVKIIGKGATGTGATGHDPAGPPIARRCAVRTTRSPARTGAGSAPCSTRRRRRCRSKARRPAGTAVDRSWSRSMVSGRSPGWRPGASSRTTCGRCARGSTGPDHLQCPHRPLRRLDRERDRRRGVRGELTGVTRGERGQVHFDERVQIHLHDFLAGDEVNLIP